MKPNEVIKRLQYLAPSREVINSAIKLIEIAKHNNGGEQQGYIIELSVEDYKEFLKFKDYQNYIANGNK